MISIAEVFLITFIMVGLAPLILVTIGLRIRKKRQNTAALLYVLAVSWLVIGGGICASLLT
jgi:hypothetical protein